MKDPDMGIYPMVTSSSTLAGYGCVGAGIPPYEITKIVVVTTAYSSSPTIPVATKMKKLMAPSTSLPTSLETMLA